MNLSVEQRLQRLITQLSATDQQMVLAFAEFLQSRTPSPVPLTPQILPRPPEESVIAAIKRLSNSYPMLEKAKLLDDTSALMAEHLLQGREPVAVIDQLETMFARHYEQFQRESLKNE